MIALILLSGGTLVLSVSCVAYIKRGVVGARPLKKQVSFTHKRTKVPQQDLDNYILLCRTNGMDYVPHP